MKKNILFTALLAGFLATNLCVAQNKKTVAVVPAVGESVSKDIRIGVTNGLQEGVFGSGEYKLLARGTAFEKALSEMQFQQSGTVSDAELTEFGHAAGADFVCYATVSKYSENEYRISYKMINVATGEIVNMGSETIRNGVSGLLTATDNIAKKLFKSSGENADNPIDPIAQYKLGVKYHDSDNYTEALKWYRKSAQQGNAEAQYAMGFMYLNGYGVSTDYYESAKWFRKSAEQGNAEAQYVIGLMYHIGEGVSENSNEAIKWYQKSAEQGHSKAQCELGKMYIWVIENPHEAIKWIRKSAEQEDVDAQYILGGMYEEGFGITKDYYEAAKWYRKSAEQGNAEAQSSLGSMYIDGLGVAQDYYEARKWFLKSAEQEHAIAQFYLGVLYYEGLGVNKNENEAIEWFKKAARQGNEVAINNLKKLGIYSY